MKQLHSNLGTFKVKQLYSILGNFKQLHSNLSNIQFFTEIWIQSETFG